MNKNLKYTPRRNDRPAKPGSWDIAWSAESARKGMVARQHREDAAEITTDDINAAGVLQDILKEETGKGLRELCSNTRTLARYGTALNLVVPVFSAELAERDLVGFFLWQGDQAAGMYAESDGMTIWQRNDEGRTRYAVGLSDHALAYGLDYTMFVIIHELAHVLHPAEENNGHTQRYHAALDAMLQHFADVTGIEVQNDYQDLPT